MKVNWDAISVQEWYLYVYEDAAMIRILDNAPVKLQQANGVKVEESGHLVISPT